MLEQSFMRLIQEVLPEYRRALDNVISTQKDLIERIEGLKLRVQTLEQQAAPVEKPTRRRRKKVEPEPVVEPEAPQGHDANTDEPAVEMAEDVIVIDGCALTPKLVSIVYNVCRSNIVEEDHAEFLLKNYGVPTAATAWVCDQTRDDLIKMGLLEVE